MAMAMAVAVFVGFIAFVLLSAHIEIFNGIQNLYRFVIGTTL